MTDDWRDLEDDVDPAERASIIREGFQKSAAFRAWLDEERLAEHRLDREADIMLGSPPCVHFSGPNKPAPKLLLPLTNRQRDVFDFIVESIRVRSMPPTLREIGARFAIRSTNTVNDHLNALERKGYIQREDRVSRGLRPTSAGAAARESDR